MERDELELLLTPRVLAAVDAEPAPSGRSDVIARSTALRRAGFSPNETATILTQARLRRRAATKFGPFANRMLFTEAGLEQATRLDVAAHHAARFRNAGLDRIADLGCGIGADSLAMGAIDLDVTAVERDPVTAAIAAYNLTPFPTVRVESAAAEEADLAAVDAVWADPARRTEGHTDTRRVGIAEYSPPLGRLLEIAGTMPAGIKLGPGFDRDRIPEDAEAQWVSAGGDVVEMTLWFGRLARRSITRSALAVTPGGAAELSSDGDSADEPDGPLGALLHEPDGAAIRARLLGDLARATGTHPVGPQIAYLTGDDAVRSPFLTTFAIDAVLPFDRLAIRKELRARGIGRLEIKKRGVDLDPATFRTFLGLRGDGDATLVVTRTTERRVALICHRVEDPAGDPPEGRAAASAADQVPGLRFE